MSEKIKQEKHATPPRQKDRHVTELALIEAATQIFSSKGFDGATTKEIAASAGYSEALIHRYFESKDGLLLAVFRHSKSAKGQTDLSELPIADTIFDELHQIFTVSMNNFRQTSAIMKIVISRAIVDPSFHKLFENTVGRVERIKILERRLRAHVETGRIDPSTDLHSAAEVIGGVAFHLGFMVQEMIQLPKAEIDRLVKTHARILSDGIARR